VVEPLGPGFKEAVEKSTSLLPDATAKITERLVFLVFSFHSTYLLPCREFEHQSPADPTNHYTAVLEDSQNNYIGTIHVKKKG